MFGRNDTNTTNPRDPFTKIGASDPSQGGVYPIPGLYPVLYVDELKMIVSRKGDDVFIAEFDVIQSEVEGRKQGTRMSWAVNFRHDASPGNVKTFLAAVMGCTADEVDMEGARYACSEKNPCHGRLVRLEAVDTTTKSGNPFTRCNWRSIPEEMQKRADDLRVEAGFPAF